MYSGNLTTLSIIYPNPAEHTGKPVRAQGALSLANPRKVLAIGVMLTPTSAPPPTG